MRRSSSGFTLLEVMVALAIAALALGSIFALLAGSKRLAITAMDKVDQVVYLRSAISAAQAQKEPDYPELPAAYRRDYPTRIGEALEPTREDIKIQYALEPYSVGEEGESNLGGLRWKRLERVP